MLTDDSPMPFGKHKGQRIQDVPASYLLWLGDQDVETKWPELHAYIEDNREVLEAEA